jgi:hypothetical protein
MAQSRSVGTVVTCTRKLLPALYAAQETATYCTVSNDTTIRSTGQARLFTRRLAPSELVCLAFGGRSQLEASARNTSVCHPCGLRRVVSAVQCSAGKKRIVSSFWRRRGDYSTEPEPPIRTREASKTASALRKLPALRMKK